VRIPEHVVYRVFTRKAILVDLKHGRYYELSHDDGCMLRALENATFRRVIERLAFDQRRSPECVRDDLTHLLTCLKEAGLIEFTEGSTRVVASSIDATTEQLPTGTLQLRGFTPAPRIEKALLTVETLATYTLIRLGFVRKRALVDQVTAPVPGATSDPTAECVTVLAMRLAKVVTSTLRPRATGATCLLRSLVLLRMLTRRRIKACLVIAVDPEAEPFTAHAWVEQDGRPLLDPGSVRLARLAQIDTSGWK
jgi:Transglutaminase-like superfamily